MGAGARRRGTADRRFPTDRGWDARRLLRPATDAASAASSTTPAEFDAELFGISPREALAMDPQQRLLLETVVGGVRAGRHRPASLRGTPHRRLRRHQRPGLRRALLGAAADGVEGYSAPATRPQCCPAGVAYTFGLEGPAVTVDTACSSSLVALHLAAQALRSGECDLALAGGVTVMATPGRVRRVQPPARARRRRPLQGVRRRRRRHRLGRGRRRAAGGAAVRRAAQRPPGARGGARHARSTRTARRTA